MLNRQASEDVIINGPMSFVGAWQRSFRLARLLPWPAVRWVTWPLILLLVAAWWLLIAAWYVLVFSWAWILLIPYRLLRRGSRKRKMEARRHRELMSAVKKNDG